MNTGSNCFQVLANNDMTISIAGGPFDGNAGFANIKGKVIKQAGAERLDVPVASGTLPRIDSIVLRRDDIQREIYPLLLAGGFSSNPQPPALVRENGIYDLRIATVRVNPGVITITQEDIADCRMDANLCGWVMSTIKEIDFGQVTAQFEAFFTRYEALVAARFILFTETMQGHDTAAQTAYENFTRRLDEMKAWALDNYGSWYNSFTASAETEVRAWFQDFQDTLSDDQAVHLFNKIYNHEQAVVGTAEVHGIRIKDGKLQFLSSGGWSVFGEFPRGIRLEYMNGMGRALDSWNLQGLSLEEMNNIIEVEA